ncbi:unconventional myosin-XV, partial [Lates japonicus]
MKGGKDDKKGGKKEEPPAKGKGKDDGKKGKGKKPVSKSEEGSEEEEEEVKSGEEEDDESEEEVVSKKAAQGKGKGKAALKGASKAMAVKGFKPPPKKSPSSDDDEEEKPQMKKGMGAVNLKKMSDVHIKGASKAMMGFAAEGQKKNLGAAKGQKTVDARSHLKGASKALSGLTGKASPFTMPSKQQPEKSKPKRNLKSTSRLFLRLSKKKKPPADGKPLLGTSKLFSGFGAKSADKKPGLSGFSLFNKKDDAQKETTASKKTINLSRLGGQGKMATEAKGLGGKFKGMFGKKKVGSGFKTKGWMLGRIAAATNWLTGRFLTASGQGRLGARAGRRGRKRLSFADRDTRGRQTHYYNEAYEYDDEYGYEEDYQGRWGPRGFLRQPMTYDPYDPYEEEMDYYDDEEWEDEYGYYDDEGNFYYDDELNYDDDVDYYSYPYGYYDDEYEDFYDDEGMEYYYGEDGMLYAVEPHGYYGDAMDGFYDPYESELYGDYFDHNMGYNYGMSDPYGMMSGGYEAGLYNDPMLGYTDPAAIYNPYQQPFYMDVGLDPAQTGQLYGQEQLSYPVAEPFSAEQFRVPRPQVRLFGKDRLDVETLPPPPLHSRPASPVFVPPSPALALNNLEMMSDIQYEQPFPTHTPAQPHYSTVMNQQQTPILPIQALSPTAMIMQQEHLPLPQPSHPPFSVSPSHFSPSPLPPQLASQMYQPSLPQDLQMFQMGQMSPLVTPMPPLMRSPLHSPVASPRPVRRMSPLPSPQLSMRPGLVRTIAPPSPRLSQQHMAFQAGTQPDPYLSPRLHRKVTHRASMAGQRPTSPLERRRPPSPPASPPHHRRGMSARAQPSLARGRGGTGFRRAPSTVRPQSPLSSPLASPRGSLRRRASPPPSPRLSFRQQPPPDAVPLPSTRPPLFKGRKQTSKMRRSPSPPLPSPQRRSPSLPERSQSPPHAFRPTSPHRPPSPSSSRITSRNLPTRSSTRRLRGGAGSRSHVPMGAVKPSPANPYIQRRSRHGPPVTQHVAPFRSSIHSGPTSPSGQIGGCSWSTHVSQDRLPAYRLKGVKANWYSPRRLPQTCGAMSSQSLGPASFQPPVPQPSLPFGTLPPSQSITQYDYTMMDPGPSPMLTNALPNPQNSRLRSASYSSPLQRNANLYTTVLAPPEAEVPLASSVPSSPHLSSAMLTSQLRNASFASPLQRHLSPMSSVSPAAPPTTPQQGAIRGTSPLFSGGLRTAQIQGSMFRLPGGTLTMPRGPAEPPSTTDGGGGGGGGGRLSPMMLSSALQNPALRQATYRLPDGSLVTRTEPAEPSSVASPLSSPMLSSALLNPSLRQATYRLPDGTLITRTEPTSAPSPSSPILSSALLNPSVRKATYRLPDGTLVTRNEPVPEPITASSSMLSSALLNANVRKASYRLPDGSILTHPGEETQNVESAVSSPGLSSALMNANLRKAKFQLPDGSSLFSRNQPQASTSASSSPLLSGALLNTSLRGASYRLPDTSLLRQPGSADTSEPRSLDLSNALRNQNLRSATYRLPDGTLMTRPQPTSTSQTLDLSNALSKNPNLRGAKYRLPDGNIMTRLGAPKTPEPRSLNLSGALQNPHLRGASFRLPSSYAVVSPQVQGSGPEQHWAHGSEGLGLPQDLDVWGAERVLPHGTVQNLNKWSMYRDGELLDPQSLMGQGHVGHEQGDWNLSREGEPQGNWFDKMYSIRSLPTMAHREQREENGVEDMTQLEEMHEGTVLLNMRKRFERELIYTYIGSILVSVNPYKMYNIYGTDMVLLYKGHALGENPPGVISGAITSQYLLEKSRIVFQAKDERNYHIFYEMLAGLPSQQKQAFYLQGAETYYYLNQGGDCGITGKNDAEDFLRLLAAMEILHFTPEDQSAIFRVLSSILHLGNVYFQRHEADGQEVASVVSAQEIRVVAELLQISPEGLQKAITYKVTETMRDKIYTPLTVESAVDARDAVSKILYSLLFHWLTERIKAQVYPRQHTLSISILDIYGFEEEYSREQIPWQDIPFSDNQPCIDLIAAKPHGILRILDDQSCFPQATDHTFLQKCHYHHGNNPLYLKPKMPLPEFTIKHFAGRVTYQVYKFLDKNYDQVRQDVLDLFIQSKNKMVSNLFLVHAEVMGQQRGGHMRKSSTVTRKYQAPTVSNKFQQSLLELVEKMERCNPFFVRCIKPNNLKQPGVFEDDLVSSQLRHSGVLETIRIRKEGYPVRMPFYIFLFRYKSLVGIRELPPANGENCVIMLSKLCPLRPGAYHVGVTKIFLKEDVYQLLECKRERSRHLAALTLQRYTRMFFVRKRYMAFRKKIIGLQAQCRGFLTRKRYVKMRESLVRFRSLVHMYVNRKQYIKMKFQAQRKAEEERRRREMELTKREVVNVTHLVIPAELGALLQIAGIRRELHSDCLALLQAPHIQEEAQLTLPLDINNYPFYRYVQIYFREPKFGMLMAPLESPLTRVEDDLRGEALELFIMVLRFMGDPHLNGAQENMFGNYIIQRGLTSSGLRDEILSQVVNQVWRNVNSDNAERGWLLLLACVCSFAPSPKMEKYLLKFVSDHAPAGCQALLQHRLIQANQKAQLASGSTPETARTYPLSLLEWTANRKKANLVLHVHCFDGGSFLCPVHSWTSGEDLAGDILRHRGVSDWWRGSSILMKEHGQWVELAGHDYVMDLIADLELPPDFPKQKSYFVISTDDPARVRANASLALVGSGFDSDEELVPSFPMSSSSRPAYSLPDSDGYYSHVESDAFSDGQTQRGMDRYLDSLFDPVLSDSSIHHPSPTGYLLHAPLLIEMLMPASCPRVRSARVPSLPATCGPRPAWNDSSDTVLPAEALGLGTDRDKLLPLLLLRGDELLVLAAHDRASPTEGVQRQEFVYSRYISIFFKLEAMVRFPLKEVQSTRTQRPTSGSSYPYVEIMIGDLLNQRITQLQLEQGLELCRVIAMHMENMFINSALALTPSCNSWPSAQNPGAIKVYGAPGVEFAGLHKDTTAVTQIHFLPGQGRLLSLLDDNTIHLWELVAGAPREVGGVKKEGVVSLQEVGNYSLPGRPGIESCSATRVTVLLLLRSCDLLCIGTEGGGVYFLQLPRLSLKDNHTLLQDQVTQSLPDDYRCGKSLGPVESLQEHPQQSGKILIGYSRGLVVLWDLSTRHADQLFLGKQ